MSLFAFIVVFDTFFIESGIIIEHSSFDRWEESVSRMLRVNGTLHCGAPRDWPTQDSVGVASYTVTVNFHLHPLLFYYLHLTV